MKKCLMLAAAAAALGTAGAAHAQYYPGQYGYGQYGGYSAGSDWNRSGGSYATFDRQYRHAIEGIRHGLNDGTFSRWQAERFYRELESIRYEAIRSMRYGNFHGAYIQARMARLHQRMHLKHERNHDRYEDYGYGVNDRSYQPVYNGYGYSSVHDHAGDDDDD